MPKLVVAEKAGHFCWHQSTLPLIKCNGWIYAAKIADSNSVEDDVLDAKTRELLRLKATALLRSGQTDDVSFQSVGLCSAHRL